MARVLAANVFITKSREAIDRLFFGESQITSFKERLLLLTEDDLKESFISSPYKNDGITRFEYSFAKGKGQYVRVNFLETQKLMEYVLMGNDPIARILEPQIEKLKDNIQKAEALNKQFSPENKKPTLESNLAKLSSSQRFYFAFGAGDDLSEWAGPYSMDLVNAVLKNDEVGTRMIDAMFVPNINSQKVWSKRFEEEFGYAGSVNNFNEMLSRRSYVKAVGTEFVPKGAKDAKAPILNLRVRNTVKNYISGITNNDNVIVAIPNDLSKIKNKPIYQELKGNNRIVPNVKYTDTAFVLNKSLSQLGIKVVDTRVSDLRKKLQRNIQAPDVIGEKTAINQTSEGITFSMGTRFAAAENMKSNNPEPILAPLFKFSSGLRSLDSESYAKQEFDLYEETDVRVLKLWEEFGLINDSSKPAFVFGDIDHISDLLYIRGYDPANKRSASVIDLVESVKFLFGGNESYFAEDDLFTNDPGANDAILKFNKYLDKFIEVFDLDDKANKSSSFQENEDPDVEEGLIFRHNISKSNVLQLNYSVDKYYAALLGLNIFPNLSRHLSNSTTFPVIKSIAYSLLGEDFINNIIQKVDALGASRGDGNGLSTDNFLNLLLTNTEINQSILERVSTKVVEDSNVANLTTFDLVAFITFVKYLNDLNLSPNSVQILDDEDRYEAIYTALVNRLKTFMVTLDIKTLPFFNQQYYLKKPCTVLGNNNSIIGFEANKRKAPYSGRYNIFGWSHVIEPDDAYSTFNLVREGLESEQEGGEITTQRVKDAVIEYLQQEIAKEEANPSEQGPPKGVKVSGPVKFVSGILNLPGIRQATEGLAGQIGVNDPYNTRLRNLKETLSRLQKSR